MVRWLAILVRTLRSTIRTQRELGLENLALRQQVAVWKVRQPRPQLTATDRLFWVVLSRLWMNWRSSLQVVRPETVVRCHRQGFRRYWAWKSRHRRGRPAIGTEVRDLIRRMSRANPLWGAPRIHGELLKLGLTVSQATWQNAYAERVIGSIRRECLDHIVVLGERHLRGILSNYVDYSAECAGAEPGQGGGGAPRGWAPSRIPPASSVSRSGE